MWVRIAARRRVWYEPRTLSVYRRHAANETARLVAAGAALPDVAAAIAINAHALPAAIRDRVTAESVRWYVSSALRTVEGQLARGAADLAMDTLSHVPRLIRLLPGTPLPSRIRRRFASLTTRIGSQAAAGYDDDAMTRCA